MRFCDLFISYKIGLKGIKDIIPFTKLPRHRKIAVITIFTSLTSAMIIWMFNYKMIALITLIVALLATIVFLVIDATKKNLKIMLQNHYQPYSQTRMNMLLNLLKNYNIDITNNDIIDLLIAEAKEAQLQSDYLAPLKKPLKTISAIIIPIVAYVAQKIGDAASQEEMLTMALYFITIVLLVFSIILCITPTIKELIYRDYNKYNELIYDLRQIKLFYSDCNKCIVTQHIH